MAFEIAHAEFPFEAGEDLSAKQFLWVKVDSAGKVVVAGANQLAIGVLQNKPTSGQAATVRCGGISKVIAGGAIAAGERVGSDSQGRASAQAPTSITLGIALEASTAAGQLIAVLHMTAGTP